MGRHSGEAAEPVPVSRRRLALLALGVTATLVAWGFLVWEAIDFGSRARDGESLAWLFVALATIGATACLLLTLVLATRVIATLRGEVQPRPVVPGGRRRAH